MKSALAGVCVFLFLAAANPALSATPARHGKQQDQQFLRTIAIADMTEAHAGEIAQSSSARTPVKDFAQTIAKDESEEYSQLSMLANKAGDSIPKGIDARKYPALRTLMTGKGGHFDRDFLSYQIADERRVIAVLQREAARGDNPDIRAWAGKAVAARQQELQKAQSLPK